MRKLKLQMQITIDGLVAGPEGQLAWMTTEAGDERLIGFITHLADTSDTILMGRKMTGGFVQYWQAITKRPESDELHFFVNPVAIGQGMRVFQGETRLKLMGSTGYPSGVVVNSYQPRS
jgi:dihydrofolate reductase